MNIVVLNNFILLPEISNLVPSSFCDFFYWVWEEKALPHPQIRIFIV